MCIVGYNKAQFWIKLQGRSICNCLDNYAQTRYEGQSTRLLLSRLVASRFFFSSMSIPILPLAAISTCVEITLSSPLAFLTISPRPLLVLLKQYPLNWLHLWLFLNTLSFNCPSGKPAIHISSILSGCRPANCWAPTADPIPRAARCLPVPSLMKSSARVHVECGVYEALSVFY